MDHAAILATLAAVHLAWNLGPGPNVVIVAHMAARESRAAGLKAALGLTAGAVIWASAAAVGLGLLSAIEWLQQIVRIAGGAYLFWLGIGLWRNAGRETAATVPPPQRASGWRPFWLGVSANLANPISLIFFSGIFAAILPPDLPTWVRAAAVLVIAVDALAWYAALAFVFSSGPARRRYRRSRRWIDRIAGTAMVVFGARLALSVR
jgi:threonine efflux protein